MLLAFLKLVPRLWLRTPGQKARQQPKHISEAHDDRLIVKTPLTVRASGRSSRQRANNTIEPVTSSVRISSRDGRPGMIACLIEARAWLKRATASMAG